MKSPINKYTRIQGASPVLCFLCCLLFNSIKNVPAQVRSSASYAISSESFTSGLAQGTSTNYKLDSSTEVTATGISTVGVYTNKQGHIAQLVDAVSIVVTATSDPVNEENNNQLNAVVTFDDTTTLNPAAPDVMWSTNSGPINSIDGDGLASLGAVYQDENATAEGQFDTLTDQVTFQVTNSNPDNFGAYGGDGLEDGWQVMFFGLPPNPDAAPGQDPDNDGQNNTYEELSGFSPIDGKQFFIFDILEHAGTTTTLELNKVIPGTRYVIFRDSDLQGAWTEIGAITPAAVEFDKEFDDTNATLDNDYYRAVLEKD